MEQESDRPRKLEFEARLLALFLFVAIPFILVGSLLIMNSVTTGFNQKIGDSLAELAASSARYLDSYILLKITTVSRLSVTPSLVQDVIEANHKYPSDRNVVQRRLLELDREWQKLGGLSLLGTEIVGRPISQYLRKVAGFNPAYQEILLTDVRGALVAATNLTTDYYQADEDWWRNAYAEGESGTIYVSNVGYDASAKVYGMQVAVPVRFGEGENQRVVGVLKALIDVRDLFAVVNAVKIGASGHAVLVNGPNRAIITTHDPDEIMKKEHPGFVHLQEALAEGRRSFVCRHDDGTVWLTGFSRMPEPGPSPEISWYVFVEQLLEEAQSPTKAATRYLLAFFAAMVLLVLALSLYTHFKLVRPIREVDLREEMEKISGASGSASP